MMLGNGAEWPTGARLARAMEALAVPKFRGSKALESNIRYKAE
jgi:hypothetical protein